MGVMAHRGLVRLRIGITAFRVTEVHVQVRQILQHDGVILRRQFADDLQFLVRQACPSRVIGVAVQDAGDPSALQVTLQFVPQTAATEVGDVESLDTAANDTALHLLHGETGVEKENRVFLRVQLDEHHVERKSRLHRTHGRQDALRRTLQVNESTDELRTPFLHLGNTDDIRVMGGTAVEQRLMLGLDTDLRGRQTRLAKRHVDILDARRLLNTAHNARQLTDTGIA